MDEQGAVLEAPPRPTLKVLRALVQIKQEEYEQLRETHTALWQKRKTATLDRHGYVDYLMCEDRMALLLHELEALTPQVRYAEAEEAVTKAKAHFDAYCEPVAAQGLRVCQTWAAFLEACAALVSLIDAQGSPLVVLTRADGQPAFDPDSGSVTLQNMLSVFPNQPNFLPASVIPFLREGLTVTQTRTILEPVKGKTPFSDTDVRRYLAGFPSPEPEPAMEAVS